MLIHKRSGNLSVQLKNAEGAPIADALLVLHLNEEDGIAELTSDANGHVNFGELPKATTLLREKILKTAI